MTFIRAGDAVLHFRHRPAPGRPAVVFVNSLGTDMRIWTRVVRLLGPDVATLTYDMRGHGLSELGAAAATIETHVGDLARLLDHLGIAAATICGLSVGGLVAQGFYAARPAAVERLVLCCTAAKIGSAAMWDARRHAAVSQGIASFADDVMRRWFTPAFHRERAEELSGYRTMLTRQEPAGYAAACAAIRDADFRASAGGIAVPTLCIAGDEDGATPREVVEELALSIPGSRFEVIAGAGHIPCVERPERFADLLRAFVLPAGGVAA